ncbi:MAG TPA: CaiB/BaiF CoA-transferase family protein [Candidatus Limnocylindria bacterium]|nr:CaiB/BaiF CoA-transferase family protein [Candidatus Limnocylindria bacterium]
MITGALEGFTCIDVSGHVAGPYAGSLLGDLGCEVIKVELPKGGDTHRGRNPKYDGYGPSFRALNRNKKSVTLNLRDKKAREILHKLLATADIFLENFRPPTRQQLGLDYDELAKLNPKLIHCSISGYGQSGPYRDKPGFDTIGQALSGMMSLVTDLDDPKVAGISFVDHSAGIFAAHGIMAALLARSKTDRGQFIDVSLLQVAIAFIESHVSDYLNGGEAVSRDNFPKGRIYSLLDCDKKPFMVHLSGHNEAWEGLLKAGELDERVGDPRFATRKQRSDRHDEIVAMLRAAFVRHRRDYWLPRLDANSIPNAPINTIQEVFDNPQIKHLGIPRQIEHPRMGVSNLVGSPINMSGTPPKFFRAAPLLGENTEEVLAKLGYDRNAVKDFKASGVI